MHMVAAGGKGPTMLVVRNKGGQVFGGYASEPWLKNGKYYGEVITSLRPSMHLMKHQLWLPCPGPNRPVPMLETGSYTHKG